MKKIIALVILVVMVIMVTAYAEDTIEMKELGFDPALNHHWVGIYGDYEAYLKGRELRDSIDSGIENVTGWCSNAAVDIADFVSDCYTDCANAVTGVAKDIGNTATNIWNCARGFVDGFFG